MKRNAKGLLIRLLCITGIVAACPLLEVIMEVSDYKPPDWILARAASLLFFLLLLPYLLFALLSLVVLPYTAWRGVTVYGMKKMEAWWWVSVPHTAIVWLYSRLLRLERFSVHLLALF